MNYKTSGLPGRMTSMMLRPGARRGLIVAMDLEGKSVPYLKPPPATTEFNRPFWTLPDEDVTIWQWTAA